MGPYLHGVFPVLAIQCFYGDILISKNQALQILYHKYISIIYSVWYSVKYKHILKGTAEEQLM